MLMASFSIFFCFHQFFFSDSFVAKNAIGASAGIAMAQASASIRALGGFRLC